MAAQRSPPAIQVSIATFNCLAVLVFIICFCNLALVFWAVEKDLVLSIASNVQLKNGTQRLLNTVRERARGEKVLTAEQAIQMASEEQQFALSLLLSAGIDVTDEIVKQLPLSSDIHSQYGKEPIIHNLDSCQRFRDSYPPEERYMAVAGMFNTGTNILGNLIVHNCALPREGKKVSRQSQYVSYE